MTMQWKSQFTDAYFRSMCIVRDAVDWQDKVLDQIDEVEQSDAFRLHQSIFPHVVDRSAAQMIAMLIRHGEGYTDIHKQANRRRHPLFTESCHMDAIARYANWRDSNRTDWQQ